ncbi:efflux RND transporter periplasmic adaptor subunit [Polyangium sorediatum]|uniref:HlyD family efflux transporter periplasmic adaptor subunit n=1 Tax=Polyangium sorediatum TaxID=889274 RepID=A0ABT6NMN2_9BACT|nr:HlyD family efflux transporter periplasmic adaptor subunit [Polyangium sorediatum]MDI1429523.1 HlyD family efflux transporter periplasmic adaptor subunit [Polyangium sorediatum]
MQRADRHRNTVLLGALVLVASCGRSGSPTSSTQPPAKATPRPAETDLATVTLLPEAETRLGIELSPVEQRALPQTITVAGEVMVPTGGAVLLVAPFSATVSAEGDGVPKAGAAVKRGQVLLRLAPFAPPDRDVRAQAEKAVSIAEAQLETVKVRVERLEKLLPEGGASEKQVEEARAERAVLEAELVAAKKRVDTIRRAPLGADVSIPLRAPRDGVLRTISVAPGQLVAAGAPLFEILGAPSFWVRAAVYAGDAARVPADASARVATLGAAASPEASVNALPVPAPPSADPVSATVDLFYELPEGTTRRPGERVTVELPTSRNDGSLVVPWSSVLFDAVGGAWVYVQKTEHAYERRRVDLARVDGDLAVLARGPSPGVPVVRVGAAELFGIEFGVGK